MNCQEFLTVDRKLSAADMEYLNEYAWPRPVTPTGFRREGFWEDDERQVLDLMARFFDAHMFFASDRTRRLTLRLVLDRAALEGFEPYLVQGVTQAWFNEDCVVLGVQVEVDDLDLLPYRRFELSALAPLRAELVSGDRRPLYLTWLRAAPSGVVPTGAPEPPVPPDLARLTSAQAVLVTFLGLDPDLLNAVRTARGSRPNDGGARSVADLRAIASQCRVARLQAEDAALSAQAEALRSAGDFDGSLKLEIELFERLRMRRRR
jgi:hypothetical protein